MKRCKSLPRIPALTFLLITGACVSAQTPNGTDANHWPTLETEQTLHVVLMSSPKHMRTCRFGTVDAEQITCLRRFGRSPEILRRKEVLALIHPAARDPTTWKLWALVGVEGAVIAGAVLLAPETIGGAVALGIGGSVLDFFAAVLVALSAEDSPSGILLYLRPGESLQVALK